MEAAGRLDSMLENLLDFAQPDDVQNGSLDLHRISRQVADFVEVEDESEDADVRVQVDVEEDARMVAGDADKIEQVLLNLVKNGVEAIEKSGRVLIGAERIERDGEPKVEVSVIDDGRGIPEGKQDEVMEPFTTDKDGGSGLGLAMVQKILRLHGTDMEIESEPGQGTSMKFYLSVSEKGSEND
jgi:signal transduction histidine kinase